MSIKETATILKLPYIKNNYEECIREARMRDLNYEEFLDELLENELAMRFSNSVKNRIRQAKFPYQMIMDDYSKDHLSTELKLKIRELETLEFIDNGENIILIGNPGTGKTALSIALATKACHENKTVLFMSVPNLLIELKEAMSLNQVTQYKKKFEKYDLVILDELGYCTFDKASGEILFNLLSSRNDKGSMIITSNLTFDRWNEIFRDQVLTGAIIDRLAYKSHLIDMSGESYRIIATRQWNEKKQGEAKMKNIEDYIKTLPKSRLDTPDISLVLFDYDTGMDLYLFRINLNEDTCMMMSSPTLDCPYCELFSPFISQLDMYYHNYGIKKDSWAIGKNYRKLMKELTGK